MRRIALIGDTHIGSPFGLMCEEWKLDTGNVIFHNEIQEKILDYWFDFWWEGEHFNGPAADVDTVVHCAEIIEGSNWKEYGTGLVTPNLRTQENIAVHILEPVVRGRTFLAVQGTDYHDGRDYKIEEAVVGRLGGHWFGRVGYWKFKGTDLGAFCAHSFGSPMLYKATAMERHSLYTDALEALGQFHEHIDLVMGAHWHRYRRLEVENREIVIAPGWKSYHPWHKDQGRAVFWPVNIGGVIIELGKKEIHSIKKYIYPPIFWRIKLQEV